MAGFYDNLFRDTTGSFGSVLLRDYKHAAKIFGTVNYSNAPRLKFLFHTYFDINKEAYPSKDETTNNFGVVVKNVKLPSYTVNIAEMNQYNRKRLIQTKIKYDPVSITFHDDTGNMIRNLWKAYYYYHYYDGNVPKVHPSGKALNEGYNKRTQYDKDFTDAWGYIGAPSGGTIKTPFFKNIIVYGFHQHSVVAYILINPIITRIDHDNYNYSESAGTMEIKMDIDYETVVYKELQIDGASPYNDVMNFGTPQFYDTLLSPIAKPGSNSLVPGKTGYVPAKGGMKDTLPQTDNLSGDNFVDYNINNVTTNEIDSATATQGLKDALNNSSGSNRNAPFSILGYGQSPGYAGTNGVSRTGLQEPPTVSGIEYAGLDFPTATNPNYAGGLDFPTATNPNYAAGLDFQPAVNPDYAGGLDFPPAGGQLNTSQDPWT